MKQPKKITWKNHPEFPTDIQGILNEQEIFTIRPIAKNSNELNLFSWAFKNDTFNNSTSSKNLGTFISSDSAKIFAEEKWTEYVNNLIDSNL